MLEYSFPPMVEQILGNRLRVLWVPMREHNGLVIDFQMPVGRFTAPQGKEGIVELTTALIQKGTETLGAEEFSQRLEQTGASLYAEIGDEQTVLGCRMLASHADILIPLFWEMVSVPGLREKEFERIKREMYASVQAEWSDTGTLAQKHFHAELCGKDHPAGRTHTIASIKRIGIEEVVDFYKNCYTPGGSTVVVAGNFEMSEGQKRWGDLFRSWNAFAGQPPVTAPALDPVESVRVRLVDKPDVEQATMILGYPVPGEMHPQRNAIALANYILGGGNFSSRLMELVRSEKGKTYGIGSQLACDRRLGIFSVSTTTKADQAGEMVRSVLEACGEYASGGVTDDELRKAKQFVIGNMAFQLEGIINVSEKLLWLRFFGRSNSYIEKFGEQIEKIGRDEVNEAIRKYMGPDKYIMAVVGRKKELVSQLERFGAVHVRRFRDDP
jgi:zinc protease